MWDVTHTETQNMTNQISKDNDPKKNDNKNDSWRSRMEFKAEQITVVGNEASKTNMAEEPRIIFYKRPKGSAPSKIARCDCEDSLCFL